MACASNESIRTYRQTDRRPADWRGQMLAKLRKVIHDADSEIVEKWKWMGSPCRLTMD